MRLEIKHQETYSRGELLLRTIFGPFYIALPHGFLLIFVGIAASVLRFLSFWIILFTGRYPQSFFEFQEKLIRWNIRVNARLWNLSDGYPRFGLNADDEYTHFSVEYPESTSRGLTLLRAFLGWLYVSIPHGFILMFYAIAVSVVSIIAFWVMLFTGKLPRGMFDFIVGYMIWSTRVTLYLNYMTDTYPPFSGDPDPQPEAPKNDGPVTIDTTPE